MPDKTSNSKLKIHDIQPTDERLTSRGGLARFQRYLKGTGWPELLSKTFSYLHRNANGVGVKDFFEQMFAFWANRTGQHLTYLDHLKDSKGCAPGLERAREKLLFQRFESNMGFYYVMAMAFNLFEAFKHDVGGDVFPGGAYPTTIRRQWFDVAGKVVSHAGQKVLKIVKGAYESLKIPTLWQRANSPPAVI